MQVLESSRDFGSVESRIIFGNALSRASLQGAEEFTSAAVLHAQIEMVLGLERMVEGDNKRVVTCRQDFLLCEGSLDFVALNHFLLAQDYTDC